MVGLRIVAVLIFGFLLVNSALGQALPSCNSISSDEDGDGFGWENNASCVVTNCDYSNAAQYNGWGWDPIAMESCAPTNSAALDSCDYSNADLHDGWGWNAGTGQSCEPLTSTSLCRDTDGDGWGWDGIASCRVGDLDNIPDPLEVLSASTIISPGELLNVPLSCRRVRWLSQFEINPLFDFLDFLNPARIFFTATFRQGPLDGSPRIEGTWNDVYNETFSLSWDMSTNDVLYSLPNFSEPYPSGILRFHKLDQFIAIDELLSAGSSGDILELITSYCVIQ